tara:strand:+ start:203 stop:412 length:210 start_codon:yes stop_codon:yes gene_type:complete
MTKYWLTAVLIIFPSSSAYAYLDPGTGSIILQAILGAIAAGLMTIKIWWQKFKSFFSKILNFSKKNNNK